MWLYRKAGYTSNAEDAISPLSLLVGVDAKVVNSDTSVSGCLGLGNGSRLAH